MKRTSCSGRKYLIDVRCLFPQITDWNQGRIDPAAGTKNLVLLNLARSFVGPGFNHITRGLCRLLTLFPSEKLFSRWALKWSGSLSPVCAEAKTTQVLN